MNIDPHEIELRQRTFAWIRGHLEADISALEHARARIAARREEAVGVLALLDQLRVGHDPGAFREALNHMTAKKDSAMGLGGPNGQMVINQIVNAPATDPRRTAAVLSKVLTAPSSDAEALSLINETVEYFAEIRKGANPADGRAAPMLSLFWMLADPDRWPALWTPATDAFSLLGWALPTSPADRYRVFSEVVRALGEPDTVLSTLDWFSNSPWLGQDPTLQDRVEWAWQLREEGRDLDPVAYVNVDAMLGSMRHAGDGLKAPIGEAVDREVSKRLPDKERKQDGVGHARSDVFVRWDLPGVDNSWQTAPTLRLWFGHEGVLFGLHPGYRETGWIPEARRRLGVGLSAPLEIIDYWRVETPSERRPGQTDFFVGRFWSFADFDWDGAREELVALTASLLPSLQTLLSDGPMWLSGELAEEPVIGDEELRTLFAEFVQVTGYPRKDDLEQQASREGMAATLADGALEAMGIAEFRRIVNTSRYGFAGNRAVLNATLADPDEDAVQELIVDVVRDLLYGQGEVGGRLDRCQERLKGLGQAGGMKLLAIVQPARFIPIYPLVGPHGKLALLPVLGIAEVPHGSQGERSVRANDLIRARLATIPELSEDPWGQMVFAYWMRDRGTPVEEDVESLEARLANASDKCTLPPNSPFLSDLVQLLRDKHQIVLYGPPGTGKTYLALELAEALAPDEDRRALVQFHPSMAYEDFMEGFRPVLRDGQLTYELTEGPLIELANRASRDPRPHVLIIDEMNRANLPKVFGELLFLLEYRGRPVKLAYRSSGGTFSLPENLWIIGTMNLADRSVGQIDAALRRRFAFVSFAPSDEQNGGLLRRWLLKWTLPTWPADIVDEVNGELEADLGHADLLIGPSYFMKEDLDEGRMAVIWRYAIEPLMSDLFHGDDALVKKYGWPAITKRFATLMPSTGEAEAPDAEG